MNRRRKSPRDAPYSPWTGPWRSEGRPAPDKSVKSKIIEKASVNLRRLFISMEQQGLLPKLFRTQYRKMVSVLCAHFGIRHIEIAEDLVSETFLAATESWPISGVPDNPEAWLYTVARNKARNHFTRTAIYNQKVAPE